MQITDGVAELHDGTIPADKLAYQTIMLSI